MDMLEVAVKEPFTFSLPTSIFGDLFKVMNVEAARAFLNNNYPQLDDVQKTVARKQFRLYFSADYIAPAGGYADNATLIDENERLRIKNKMYEKRLAEFEAEKKKTKSGKKAPGKE
jgi:hypothetical protein